MTKKLIILVILLLVSIPVFAQEIDTAWVRRYNGPADTTEDVAQAIAVDASGNVYVTGYSWGNGSNYDYATIRYSAAGDTVWVRRYNGPQNNWDQAHALALDGSGNIYVTGESRGLISSPDYATIKYYPNGDTAWLRRYNGTGNAVDNAYAIAVDASANVYVTGASADTTFTFDYATIKYNSNGGTAWVKRYNGPGNDWDGAYAIAVDGSGNVSVTGKSFGSGTDQDYATIKYYSNGDTAWVRRYNGTQNNADEACDIAVDGSGNVYVTGYSYGIGTGADYATIKYNSSGDTVWVRRYNGTAGSIDYGRAIAVDGSGNVYVTGLSYGSSTGEDYCTIKYKPNGDTAWVRRYNGPGNAGDDAHAIALDGSGNVYVTGESFGSGANYDYLTIKYDPDGYTIWEKRYNGPENGQDHGYAMALDGFANVYVTGESFGSGTDYDYTTIKYSQYVCGDANGDEVVDIADLIYLFHYCFLNGPPPPINPASGDMDGYGSTTIRDITYLRRYIFYSGPAPYCNPGSEYKTTGEPADAIIVSPNLLPANDSTIAVTINYQNNSSIVGFAIPLKITIGGDIPLIGSAIFSSRITNLSGTQAATIDSAQGTVNVGFCAGLPSVLSPGSGTILTLNLSITPVAYDRRIQVDTVRLASFNYPMFIKQSNLAGVIPGYMLQDRNDTVLFIAYSPVNLIVTNPDGDSIELGFNNIPNATYDTTTDRNHDGHKDDIITIPNPVVGQYLVRVVTEPGDSGNYTCAVKLDGNEERVMIANAPAPGPGQVDTVVYTVPEYLHGDANRDGKKTVSDVVFLINYLFKGGPAPDPVDLGDVNFCKQNPPVEPGQPTVADVVYLVNYLFKGGPPPCS